MLLLVSLALKFNGGDRVPADALEPVLRTAASRLAAQHYAVTFDPSKSEVIARSAGDCTMALRLLDPHGTYAPFFRSRIGAIGRLRYAWHGEWHDDLPRFGPLLDYYFQRELARQGLPAMRSAVWLVAADPACPELSADLLELKVALDGKTPSTSREGLR